MKYDWSKERIESVIADCDSLSQVLEKLNIPRAGNNTATLRKKLEEFNIDYSHFKGRILQDSNLRHQN